MMKALLPGMLAFVLTAMVGQASGQEQQVACDKPDLAQHSVVLSESTAGYTDAERSCWIDWEQAQELNHTAGGQWVDVRDAGATAHLTLPGVFTVHWADVGDKVFLQGQSLVLLGTGTDLKKLSGLCVELRNRGHFESVHVLLGGVRTWHMAGQPVQINEPFHSGNEITPHDLWLGAADDLWQVAVMGLTAQQVARLPVPHEDILDLGVDIRQAGRILNQQLSFRQLPAQRQWLVVADTVEHLALIRQTWQQQGAKTANQPAWLVGAWPAYVSYLEQQTNIAAHAGQPLARLCGM